MVIMAFTFIKDAQVNAQMALKVFMTLTAFVASTTSLCIMAYYKGIKA